MLGGPQEWMEQFLNKIFQPKKRLAINIRSDTFVVSSYVFHILYKL